MVTLRNFQPSENRMLQENEYMAGWLKETEERKRRPVFQQ